MLRFSRQTGLGSAAPDFALPDTDGRVRSLAEFGDAPALLVAFICNHCPFVLHMIGGLTEFAREYAPRGLQVVAISSNDTAEFPEDDYAHMARFAAEQALTFPYLHDAMQEVALAYGAICTPDLFLYDAGRRLFYAGQFDASRPRIDRPPLPGAPPLRTDLPVTGEDLRAATDALLGGAAAFEPQRPSAGCSIKWLPDKNPSWA